MPILCTCKNRAAVTFGLESQNIVGYQTSEAGQGFNCMGAAFTGVANSEYNIQDFKPIAPEGEDAGGWNFYIAEMTMGGATAETYVFLTAEGDGVAKDGWYSADDGETLIKRSFKPGEGFFIDAAFEEYNGIQSAGQVNLDVVKTPVGSGFNAVCNPRAMPVNIQDIKPIAPEGEDAGGWNFYIAEMTMGGATGETYVYLTADGDGVDKDGWYSADDGETLIEKNYDAGKGFFVDCGFDGASYIEFKAITL